MEIHTTRPMLQELQELYEIAVREHGPHARSVRFIGEALQRELQARSGAAKPTTGAKKAPPGRKEGPGQ